MAKKVSFLKYSSFFPSKRARGIPELKFVTRLYWFYVVLRNSTLYLKTFLKKEKKGLHFISCVSFSALRTVSLWSLRFPHISRPPAEGAN